MKPAPTIVTGPLDFTVHNLQAEPETVAALAAIDWNWQGKIAKSVLKSRGFMI